MPDRGDVVIVTPPGETSDYIKRVIGVPGDTVQVVGGRLFLNGRAVKREARGETMIPVDDNVPCDGIRDHDPDGTVCEAEFRVNRPDGGPRWVLDRAVVFERRLAQRLLGRGQRGLLLRVGIRHACLLLFRSSIVAATRRRDRRCPTSSGAARERGARRYRPGGDAVASAASASADAT